ncbi:MAG: glycosyltransferase [Anaerolineae bacterium]|nr:glycosyltransferase [Anaerolineae bacterium]
MTEPTDRPLHILHITPYYAPAWSYGGVVSAVTGLATAQAERGHRVTVLTTDALDAASRFTSPSNLVKGELTAQLTGSPSPQAERGSGGEVNNGVHVIRCRNLSNMIRARYNLSLPIGFRRTFQRLIADADIVHTHELRTVENLLIGCQQPVVLSPHGTLPYGTGRSIIKRVWDRLFGQRLLRKIDHIAALTVAEADEARTLWQRLAVPFPGTTIIPNGVAADFTVSGDLRPRYQLGDGPIILFLGRLHERKGLQYLIPAFSRIIQAIPASRLLIVGPDSGMLESMQLLTTQLGIADRVVFTGMLTGADQQAALATAAVFVLPAVGEGLSMAALEAMAAGLPVILTPGCNLPGVETRGAGLLVERAVEPLATALQALLTDADRRRRMGKQGRAWVRESFTWPAVAAQTEALYRRLIQRT